MILLAHVELASYNVAIAVTFSMLMLNILILEQYEQYLYKVIPVLR